MLVCVWVYGLPKITSGILFSPSTTWDPRVKLMSTGLATQQGWWEAFSELWFNFWIKTSKMCFGSFICHVLHSFPSQDLVLGLLRESLLLCFCKLKSYRITPLSATPAKPICLAAHSSSLFISEILGCRIVFRMWVLGSEYMVLNWSLTSMTPCVRKYLC